MRAILRLVALAVALFSLVFWLFGGPNVGWTKTSVDRIEIDPVTGLEGHFPEKRFVPGVDFLGVSLLAAVLLAGSSWCCRKKQIGQAAPKG
jgi:hypothetical protein